MANRFRLQSSGHQTGKAVVVWIGSITIVAMVLVTGYGIQAGGTRFWILPVLGLGLLAIGSVLGLLFAVPRSPMSERVMPTAAEINSGSLPPAARVIHNDNLVEIANWLTKIVVGLGLVHLYDASHKIQQIASSIALAIVVGNGDNHGVARAWASQWRVPASTPPNLAIVYGSIAYFPIAGFLLMYLVTRIFLQAALIEGDVSAAGIAARPSRPNLDTEQDMQILQERAIVEEQTASKALAADAISPPSKKVQDELATLVNEYQTVLESDYEIRVSKKNVLARAIYATAVRLGISRNWLAAQTGDGYVVGVATAAEQAPDPTDVERLIGVGSKAVTKHAKYRVVLGIRSLAEHALIPSTSKQGVMQVLDKYLLVDDVPLRNLVVRTQFLLR